MPEVAKATAQSTCSAPQCEAGEVTAPPGAGKTMIAKAIPGLLPALAPDDALEVTTVHSAAGIPLPAAGLVSSPPFRAPHHTSSMVSLVGGGTR